MSRTINLILATLAAGAVLASGCARTVVQDPLPTDYDETDITAQLDFWHELPGRSAVSNNEGLHGVILLFDGTDPTDNYESRVALLKEKGWLPRKFAEPGDLAMQRGTLAYALCRAMDFDQGGVMYQLTDGSPRYATRELTYAGVMPEGSDLMVVDGLDYVGVVSRAQDYMVVRGHQTQQRNLRKAAEIEEKRRTQDEEELQRERSQ